MAEQSKLLVGTSKGLVIIDDLQHWKISRVQFEGLPIAMVYVDERTNTWWISISHRHWGEKLHCSKDDGHTWKEANTPDYKNHFYQKDKPASLKKIWCMQHAGIDRPDGLWLGTEPGGLFYSNDAGKEFHLVESLWNHPSRLDPKQWFGAGKDYPFIHSIVLDPHNSDHIYIGVSCAGVFETRDGGKNWNSKNKGLIAAYLPNPNAEVGHDPHRLLISPIRPNVLWQQNHCGIFRTVNDGEEWNLVSGKNGFPNYGFAITIDEKDPNIAWVIPAQSDDRRIPVDLRLTVCKTTDAGQTWNSFNKGLPESTSFDLALRHAFAKKENILAFGTNNGNIYCSLNGGEDWKSISQNLSLINYLAFA